MADLRIAMEDVVGDFVVEALAGAIEQSVLAEILSKILKTLFAPGLLSKTYVNAADVDPAAPAFEETLFLDNVPTISSVIYGL